MIPSNRFDSVSSLTGGCSSDLDAFRFFFKIYSKINYSNVVLCYRYCSPFFFFFDVHIRRVVLATEETVCVFVFFPFILDIKFVGRTSRGYTGGRSHRISHPPSFCDACLNFYREKDSAIPFPRRP